MNVFQNVYTDEEIEQKWQEHEDVIFNEDEDGELILEEDWFMFDKGTSREEIWHWFDKAHTKGVSWLLYDYDCQ